ncbi:MAG: hypothetical protein NW218_06360 [Saprospiraceae bacterium]|nr:hypothetical protein [Saprospiraceae bacterium]
MQFKLLFLILLGWPASLPAKDSPETLAWVQQLGVKIENTLHDAILSNDWPNMLVKLMECHDEFDAIALVGLHCHEARIAAELGRNYCNWLNSYVRDKDLNACIIRAQAAREQAHRMIAFVAECSRETTAKSSVDTVQSSAAPISLVNIIHAEVDAITLHLEAAISPKSQVDSYFQLEQSYRIFIDLAHLTATLTNCDATHSATSSGMNACLLAILSKTPEECRLHIQAVKKALERLKIEAIQCQ